MEVSLKYLSAVPALLLGAACSGAESAAVVYRLSSANGDSLPALLEERDGCRHVLTDGAVVFPGDETFRSTFDIRIECPGQPAETSPEVGTAGRLEVRSDTARFFDANGNETGSGVLTADSLIVQGVRHRLVYIRNL